VKVFSHLIEEKFGKSLAEKLLVRNPARAFEMK
jgi:hypothetical protein